MLSKFLTSKILAWVVPISLIVVLGSEAYARIHHKGHPVNLSGVHEPEMSPIPVTD